MDLVSLGRFALLPEDELNLAALLRSPLIGFSEDELYALAQPRESSLWNEIVSRREERPTLEFAHTFLRECRARADFTPPYEFFAHVLGAHGGRKRLACAPGCGGKRFLSTNSCRSPSPMRHSHTPSLEGFLHWLESGDVEIKRDMERGRDEVRVMTVHGAKGLEADIVILPTRRRFRKARAAMARCSTQKRPGFPVPDLKAPDVGAPAKAKADADALHEQSPAPHVAADARARRASYLRFRSKAWR